jgi:hypothetical protein
MFTGSMAMSLAQAHWEVVRAAPQTDLDRLSALNDIAAQKRRHGDLEGARELFEELLGLSRRVFGDLADSTLGVMANLGRLLRQIGQAMRRENDASYATVFMAARALLEESLEGRQQVAGPLHEETFAAMADLAVLHNRAGNTDRCLRRGWRGCTDGSQRQHLHSTHCSILVTASHVSETTFWDCS